MQGNFRPVENPEQFFLVGVKPLQQPVEQGEACLLGEDAVEPRCQLDLAPGRGIEAPGTQLAVEPPDQAADFLLGFAIARIERFQFVDQAFCVNPAQSVEPNIELPGIAARSPCLDSTAIAVWRCASVNSPNAPISC